VATRALKAHGEERRRAVCGRTACTVRCGGGRKPSQLATPRGSGASRRPYRGRGARGDRAAAQFRPTQQRAGAPRGAPGLFLFQEAGVSPCGPWSSSRARTRQRRHWLLLVEAKPAPPRPAFGAEQVPRHRWGEAGGGLKAILTSDCAAASPIATAGSDAVWVSRWPVRRVPISTAALRRNLARVSLVSGGRVRHRPSRGRPGRGASRGCWRRPATRVGRPRAGAREPARVESAQRDSWPDQADGARGKSHPARCVP
jgi:hypothetical protein